MEISTVEVTEGRAEIVERDLGVQRRLVLTLVEVDWLGGYYLGFNRLTEGAHTLV